MKKRLRFLTACLLISSLFSMSSCYFDFRQTAEKPTEKQTEAPTEPITEAPKITKIDMPSQAKTEITLKLEEVYESYFIVEGDFDYTVDDFALVASNKSIAYVGIERVSVTNQNNTYIYYKIKAIEPGYITLYLQTKEGTVKSQELSVILNDPQYEFEEQFLLKAGEIGDYGRWITYNKGTKFEEKLIGYYIPAGTYLFYNPGSSRAQVNVFTDETHLNSNGMEEPIDAFSILVGVGETKLFTIGKGYHIELTEPTCVFMSKMKE
ncbi:MAG: hypothetical protein IJW55_07565 [Clostridia bacterium]|nr:hypothetical protein [Clostridia bacterium]